MNTPKPAHLYQLCFVLIFQNLLLQPQQSIAESRDLFRTKTNLSHIAFSENDQAVYVAGTNHLFQLSWNLQVIHDVKTGPRQDSPACHVSGCEENSTKVLTDNHNKVLLVDKESRNLITCGSVYQGSCAKHDLRNISGEQYLVPEPIAANDKASSTFAFIGPQRYNRWGHGNVLYVGTTFTPNGDYRDDVPAISSRNLHDFQFAEFSFSKQSLLRIDVKYRDRFLVKYVYGFNSSDHIYFVTVQKKSHRAGDEEKGYVTRLARSCISDANYDSYTEVTLECQDRTTGKTFNLINDAVFHDSSSVLYDTMGMRSNESFLFGSFSPTVGYTDEPQNDTAICIFSLSQIEQLFNENIHRCFNGSMQYRNMEYISGPIQEGNCLDIGSSGNINNFCEVGLKISGLTAISTDPVFTLPGHLGISVHFTEERQYSILYIGTAGGFVFRVLFAGPHDVRILSETPIYDGSAIMDVRVFEDHMYLLQKNSVLRLPVSNCEQWQTCGDCLKAKDPSCGWCALENKCTLRSHCPAATIDNWFAPGLKDKCVHLQRVEPPALAKTSRANVSLFINSLPQLPRGQNYVCVYSDLVKLEARPTPFGLICPNPRTLRNPTRLSGASVLPLSVSYTDSDAIIVNTTIPIYDCDEQKTCRSCSSSQFDCMWCTSSNKCVSSGRECEQQPGVRSLIRNTNYCPVLLRSNRLRIPNDTPVKIELPFEHLPRSFDDNQSYWCLVAIEEANFKVSATLRGSTIQCKETRYKYLAPVGEVKASISVLVNDVTLDSTNITVFKCDILGSYKDIPDCSLCQTRENGCAWCGNQCVPRSQCRTVNNTCPKPEIFYIRPTTGPVGGNTKITIEGSNLATSLKDVLGKVRIAGRKCIVTNFTISVGIECQVPRVNHEQVVPVTLDSKLGLVTSRTTFQFLDFTIAKVVPRFGPMSGGTRLRVMGSNLNIGNRVKIFLDDLPCQLASESPISKSSIVCLTPSVERSRKTFNVHVEIDGAVRSISHEFVFTQDPVIREIKPLKTFASGGRIITVHGDYFASIAKPSMVLMPEDKRKVTLSSSCEVLNTRLMECRTPRDETFIHKPGTVRLYQIGFKMDNVTSLLELPISHPTLQSVMSYVEDPKYFKFNHPLKEYKGDQLVIEGEKINFAANERDVNVKIGTSMCNITSITETQLLCFPPKYPPVSVEDDYPEVVVQVGENLKFKVGNLKYSLVEESLMSAEVIGAIGATAAILVFLSFAVLIIFKHKSSLAEREYKRIQIQMDTLENNVRSECKQAFAELQTAMTDLTSEIESSGIPMRDYKFFFMGIFFPGVVNHPILQNSLDRYHKPSNRLDFSVNQFEQLLLNKWFLLATIEAVERQPTFSIRDRVNFASLLTIVLLTRMEYFSDVLRSLLKIQIEKSVHSRHPQLMLRRTESVAEKLLTNWLTLCLSSYVRDHAAPSMFLLFKAIKCQIEKGPIDAITQEARYSLSEEGLLREPVTFSSVTCLVVQRELDEAYQTKVLDCDTISQVKAKILNSVYKNTPFSLRPSVDEVDLEWKCGQDAHIILQDIDLTSKTIDGKVKLLNTFQHYGIKNKAVVTLIPKQVHNFKQEEYLSQNCQFNHLVWPESDQNKKAKTNTSHKSIPEVFLTRLLSTKGTIQKFIDDVFNVILTVDKNFPPVIKWLFDIFDEAAIANNVTDPNVIHAWKSNSVPLRFWVNILKNPDIIFDIEKTYAVDVNLSIIAQTFMDACSCDSQLLSKDSPSHKLLFAKDIQDYRRQIATYYDVIERLPQISDQDLNYYLHQMSLGFEGEFNQKEAVKELFLYCNQYYQDIMFTLTENDMCRQSDLASKLESISKAFFENDILA